MREKKKRSSGFFAVLGLWICMGLAFWGRTEMTAYAAEPAFDIGAEMLSSDGDAYEIMLTVENEGNDWEGTVRLMADEDYQIPCAYDTVISLPQGSKKQFMVKIPKRSIEDTDGTVRITLWDKKDEKVAEKEFSHLLLRESDMLCMGILSDNYTALTYLDMGGEEIYFYGNSNPVRLAEVKQGTLVDTLDTLTILVIDNFNTDILTDEELNAIETWNYNGGVLIVGTGNHAENVLKGFENSYLGIENIEQQSPNGAYNNQYHSEVDFAQLYLAELRDRNGIYNEDFLALALSRPYGDGAIGVLPYALTELGEMDDSFYISGIEQEMYVRNLLENVSSEAQSRYYNSGYDSDYETADTTRRMLRVLGNSNSPLKFDALKILIVLYVILVGPVLYIVLRLTKKRELYWVAVPVAAFIGIIVVFFAGRGFEVVNTRVYSVTTENLSDSGRRSAYLYCYDASHKEWDLKLSKGYEYVGSLMDGRYGYDDEQKDVYYHHVSKEGDTLSFGIEPTSSFEDSYFYASSVKDGSADGGNILTAGVASNGDTAMGMVANETSKDFLYYAVVVDDILYVYESLPAGSTVNLDTAIPVYCSTYNYSLRSDYVYDLLNSTYRNEELEKAGILAALGVGLCDAYPRTDVDALVVVGVTADVDNAVDDDCKEISYGCFYTTE